MVGSNSPSDGQGEQHGTAIEQHDTAMTTGLTGSVAGFIASTTTGFQHQLQFYPLPSELIGDKAGLKNDDAYQASCDNNSTHEGKVTSYDNNSTHEGKVTSYDSYEDNYHGSGSEKL